MIETLIVFYCVAGRFLFEWMGVVMSWFVFSHFWAGVVTFAYLVWVVLSKLLPAKL